MNRLLILIGWLFSQGGRFIRYCKKCYQLSCMKVCGNNVVLGNNCIFTYDHIEIGNHVFIGSNACFQSAHGIIRIGNHVMFGPNVHIHGGNHAVDRVGVYMMDVHDKNDGDDGEVIIQNDVWVGAGAIILKGVTIGEGSVIGAGSVVTKDVPPYSIYTGVSDVRIRSRWDEQTIKQHKELLNKQSR